MIVEMIDWPITKEDDDEMMKRKMK